MYAIDELGNLLPEEDEEADLVLERLYDRKREALEDAEAEAGTAEEALPGADGDGSTSQDYLEAGRDPALPRQTMESVAAAVGMFQDAWGAVVTTGKECEMCHERVDARIEQGYLDYKTGAECIVMICMACRRKIFKGTGL